MIHAQLTANIANAKERLVAAEQDLAEVLQQIKTAPRADKEMVAEGFQRALDSIRAAKQAILDLDTVVATDVSQP